MRWVRIRMKALWLAYRIARLTRRMRAFRAKLEAHMQNSPKRMHDENDKFLMEQLRRMQEQDRQFRAAARRLGNA